MGKLTFLGTGTSTGIPIIGCECEVCLSTDINDKRLRSSAWVRMNGQSLLIDTSTDLRQQALNEGISRLDAVLFTHHHADHVHGIDELRSFNFIQHGEIPCYGSAQSLHRIKTMFSYIWDGDPVEGGGIPKLRLEPIEGPFSVNGVEITPVAVEHGSMDVFGFRISGTAYVTDCSHIPDESLALLQGLDTLVLGALGLKFHSTHFTIEQALETIEILKPKKAYLTHLNHTVKHETVSARLPGHVKLAWDGLTIDI